MQLPKAEIQWRLARNAAGEVLCLITSLPDRSLYKLYVPEGEEWRLWGRDRSAGKLAERFDKTLCH